MNPSDCRSEGHQWESLPLPDWNQTKGGVRFFRSEGEVQGLRTPSACAPTLRTQKAEGHAKNKSRDVL